MLNLNTYQPLEDNFNKIIHEVISYIENNDDSSIARLVEIGNWLGKLKKKGIESSDETLKILGLLHEQLIVVDNVVANIACDNDEINKEKWSEFLQSQFCFDYVNGFDSGIDIINLAFKTIKHQKVSNYTLYIMGNNLAKDYIEPTH